jgi:adenylate cyclase class 1
VGDVISEAMRALLTFNIEHQLNQQNALSELSHMYRRFYQTGEKQIKLLPSVFKPEANTEKLYLYRFETDKRWHMSHVPLNNASQNALFTHAELIHLLAFAVGNHLLTKSNWLSINDEFQRVNTVYGVELAHQLSRSDLTLDQADFSLDHSTNSDALKQVMLFVNIEMLPDETLSQQGINLSSNLNDPLNYSSFQKCLVARIDTLFQTDSGVWHSMVYEGVDAVPALLTDIINAAPSSTFDCQVWCPTPIFGHAISERLRLLLDSLHQHHQAYPHHGRLLLNIASRGYTIEWQAQRAAFQRRALHQDIWQELSNQRDAFTPTLMDRHLDKDKLFETLLSHQQADRISAFIYSEKSTIICYLLDEYGNLVRQQFQHLTERTLLGHLKQFLGEIQRQNTIAHLQFYRLSRLEQRWLLTPLSAPTMTEGYLPIKITLSGLESAADCTVLCGQKWFEGAANDPNLFQKIRDLVLSVRKQHQHYPIYLNSLQFTSGSYYPAGLYFQQKQRLERLVNPN